ncbi:MAG: 8-amino-7-oxononanoate synthase [Sphingomonas bacterium]
MPVDRYGAQRADLARIVDQGQHRALAPRIGIDFASNDYLAIARDPRLADAIREALGRGVAVGSGGSRLLRGNSPEHEALETQAARWCGSEAAIYLSSGFAANSILFSTLPQRGDLIVHDELIHASVHEGMRLSRAERAAARHNDADAVDLAIRHWRGAGNTGRPWIAVESLYSMDGDRAPLDALAGIADRHDAILVVDEAHAVGVFGERGVGLSGALAGRENVIVLRTCGKALGCEGALLCGPRIMRDFIVNRGRGFIFSTAPSPLMASAVSAAIALVAGDPARQARLGALVDRTGRAFEAIGVAATGSQIIPVVIGDDAEAVRLAAALQRRGFDIRGIRPPTVPPGTARLRVSLTLNVTEADVAALVAAIGELR